MNNIIMWSVAAYCTVETAKSIVTWGSAQVLYTVPSKVYKYMYPKESETELLVKELREVRRELRMLNEKNTELEEKIQTAICLEDSPTGIKAEVVEF